MLTSRRYGRSEYERCPHWPFKVVIEMADLRGRTALKVKKALTSLEKMVPAFDRRIEKDRNDPGVCEDLEFDEDLLD